MADFEDIKKISVDIHNGIDNNPPEVTQLPSSVKNIIFSYDLPSFHALERHFGKSTSISKPITIKSYNKTRDGRIKENGPISALQKCSFPIDLDAIDIQIVESAPTTEEFTNLLEKPLPFSFVTFRNNLNKIGNTPYDRKRSWKILVHREKETIYLNIVNQKDPDQHKFEHFMRWGYAFEVAITDKTAHGENEHVIIKDFKLGGHKVCMACEVDCVDPKTGDFVELKTHKIITHRKQEESLIRYKMRKAWLQSYLAGVPWILFGFRDNKGSLSSVKMYQTSKLPKLAERQRNSWNNSVCLNYIAYVFDLLQKHIKEGESYTLEYLPESSKLQLHLH